MPNLPTDLSQQWMVAVSTATT